jgi:alpha-D-xyloside xylohydrolase
LYDDDGLTYNYEKGLFTRIGLRWNEANKTLTIGKRQGSFPEMLLERTFQVVLVSKARAVGFSFTPQLDRTVQYTGEEVSVKFDQ